MELRHCKKKFKQQTLFKHYDLIPSLKTCHSLSQEKRDSLNQVTSSSNEFSNVEESCHGVEELGTWLDIGEKI